MKTNAVGIELIKRFEGFKGEAYFDRHGSRWTIGYGTTLEVSPGDRCTEDVASVWLRRDIAETERLLLACLPDVPLNENQFSALVSFVYNVGMGKWGSKDGFRELREGGTSRMRKLLLAHDYQGASLEFPKWCRAGGVQLAGLLKRRLAEQALFRAMTVS